MLFAIGTRVRFRYTGERGTITARLDDDMLQVRLDSDPSLEIPAFEEDLERDTLAEPASAGAKFVPGKKSKEPEAPPRRVVEVQYIILKPKGLQLAFEPMPGRDGSVTRFKAWLINDTSHEFIFEFDLFTATRDVVILDDKISKAAAIELGTLIYDDLNDSLEVFIRASRITTAGTDEPVERQLKIKPKQFFNNLQTAVVLNVLAHVFVLLEPDASPSAGASAESSGEDLRAYTREKARGPRGASSGSSRPFKAFSIDEFASFVPEIDLHIENLIQGYARLDKSEILRIQLQHCQRFLEKAVRLGVHQVFIIHGVGEGKLRDAIAQQLREHPHVRKFKNEFHPKYGYGATEVLLD